MTTTPLDPRVPTADVVEKALRNAAARATLAPSIHNTQPWRFVIHSDRLDLLVDSSRRVPVIDPTGRQATISCGAALFGARVALAAAQIDGVTALLPDPAHPELLATITVAGPAAELDEAAQRLDAVAEDRHSNRRQFSRGLIPDHALDAAMHAAEIEGASLHPLRELEDRVAVAVLSQRAESIQDADPAYREELRAWITDDPDSPDGVPVSAVPQASDEAHDDIPIREFDTSGTGELPAETRSRLDQSMLILTTPGDDERAWLIAGQALGRVLLELTSVGLKTSILSQVTEVSSTRDQLRHDLRLRGNVQLMLRAGIAAATPATPRRPLTDVITDVTADVTAEA
ncbi:Acg family FMN-binding oxidoreductase [Jatrophihabitans sp. DSM 45814]